jgi:K+-transporting ATPase KdpF subunit
MMQFCIIIFMTMHIKTLLTIVSVHTDAATSNNKLSYLIGGIFAVLIMGYLIYTLMKPDKF